MSTHSRPRSGTGQSHSPSKSRSQSSEKILKAVDASNERRPTPSLRPAETSHRLSQRRASEAISRGTRSTKTKRNSTYIPHSASGSQLQDRTSLQSPNPRSSICHSLSVPGDDTEFHLVRNFSITSKGIINRGDSFRSKSRSTSLCSTPTSPTSDQSSFPVFVSAESPGPSTPGSSSPVASASPLACASPPKYKVLLVGSNGVGKTAIRNQFMTSDYICQYDNWNDESSEKSVTVSLDGEETELEIVECVSVEDKNRLKESAPDAYIIVYSVTNRRSYVQAKQILSRLETTFSNKAAILVGNKTDLARLRTVTTVEGRSLAKERGCKFIETSVAINHQVDELLVGIITQIRIKAKIAEKQKKKSTSGRSQQNSRSKATCIIKRLWRRTCMTSKSCDNLHAL